MFIYFYNQVTTVQYSISYLQVYALVCSYAISATCHHQTTFDKYPQISVVQDFKADMYYTVGFQL